MYQCLSLRVCRRTVIQRETLAYGSVLELDTPPLPPCKILQGGPHGMCIHFRYIPRALHHGAGAGARSTMWDTARCRPSPEHRWDEYRGRNNY